MRNGDWLRNLQSKQSNSWRFYPGKRGKEAKSVRTVMLVQVVFALLLWTEVIHADWTCNLRPGGTCPDKGDFSICFEDPLSTCLGGACLQVTRYVRKDISHRILSYFKRACNSDSAALLFNDPVNVKTFSTRDCTGPLVESLIVSSTQNFCDVFSNFVYGVQNQIG